MNKEIDKHYLNSISPEPGRADARLFSCDDEFAWHVELVLASANVVSWVE